MELFVLALACVACADEGYEALRARDYDRAISLFRQASPKTAGIHKDLAYTYLKTGDTISARDEFERAMELDPEDWHAALEYAFLCFETKLQDRARRTFDRVRKEGDPESRATAERAFQSIDVPLAEGIARWTEALSRNPGDFSAHKELAQLAEQRDEHALAAEHYEAAWRLRPRERSFMIDLARVWRQMGKRDAANALLLAASRCDEPHTAERAREMLPFRYPYVYEFREALKFDPANVGLHRELAYLLLEMGHNVEAEAEFEIITREAPQDLLSVAQLGFLRHKRGDASSMQLLESVLTSNNEEIADRVRSVLRLPRTLPRPPDTPRAKVSIEAKSFAQTSFDKGYLKDSLKYFKIAHDNDPLDFEVMLKLGWNNNALRDDRTAARWFDLARRSPQPSIANEAERAWRNLEPDTRRLRTTAWLYPFWSSRWKEAFTYAQVKTELRLGKLPLRPYISARFTGDSRAMIGSEAALTERAVVAGVGLATPYWKGTILWAEAGSAIRYLKRSMTPDYRGGISFSRRYGNSVFFETNDDGLYVSQFDKDWLVYSQNRTGVRVARGFDMFWNYNATLDLKRYRWANFVETGPGMRLQVGAGPQLHISVLRGAYLINHFQARPNYWDVRAGFWYALTH
jgi:Tfp pilus assembly protein PilF